MNKRLSKIKYLIGIILIGIGANAQDLQCVDFKEGTFSIPGEKGQGNALEVIRQENTQMEFKDGIESGEPQFVNLEWIDDCTYRMTYEEADAETDEQKRFINDNDGIVVEKLTIEGNCMTYKATLTTLEGEEITQEGRICKE